MVLGDAVARHDIDRLLWGRRPDQAAAFGFQLRSLRCFQGLLGQVAQAGVGVAVAQGRWASGCLTLALRLPFGGCFGALGAFPPVDKITHALHVALGLLAIGFIGLISIALRKWIIQMIVDNLKEKKYIMADGFRQRY